MKIKRFCIVCEKKLLSAAPPFDHEEMDITNPPSGGVHFTTTGNWGSRLYDSFGRAYLEGNICDDCLRAKSHLLVEAATINGETVVQQWTPHKASLADDPRTAPPMSDELVAQLKAAVSRSPTP